MPPPSITTARLTLIPVSPELLRLELADRAAFAAALDATVPAGWPPGDYDADAARFFLQQLDEHGDRVAGWQSYYAVTRATPRELIAAAGYFGPPDETGTVEIGFSVVPGARGGGIATEIADALCAHAGQTAGVRRVIARSRTDNVPSHRVLLKSGFHEIPSADPALKRFERAV